MSRKRKLSESSVVPAESSLVSKESSVVPAESSAYVKASSEVSRESSILKASSKLPREFPSDPRPCNECKYRGITGLTEELFSSSEKMALYHYLECFGMEGVRVFRLYDQTRMNEQDFYLVELQFKNAISQIDYMPEHYLCKLEGGKELFERRKREMHERKKFREEIFVLLKLQKK